MIRFEITDRGRRTNLAGISLRVGKHIAGEARLFVNAYPMLSSGKVIKSVARGYRLANLHAPGLEAQAIKLLADLSGLA